jgi:hypothetical protein
MVFGLKFILETGLTKMPSGLKCFYCSAPIQEFPYIDWLGTSEIDFHPACVIELCVRLLRDVHQVECESKLEAHLTTDREERKQVLSNLATDLGVSEEQARAQFLRAVQQRGRKL